MSVKSSIGALRLSTKTIHTFPLLLIVKYHLACLDILLLANDVTRLHIKLERENNESSNKAFVLEKLLFPSSEKNTADSKTGNDCAASIRFCLFTKARLGQTNMAVLFRRLTEHMQRFDGLFSSALLKSKILYITQGYLHFSHPVLHKYWSLQFIEWCLFSAYISERF